MQILSVVKAELGSLDRVQRVVRTFGMVNAGPDFRQHPQVINGFSDLLVEVFGLSYQEAADVLGVAVGTVKSRMFRARRALCAAIAVDDEAAR